MVDIPKLDIIGFTSILAGFIFLATGLFLLRNSINTAPEPVNPVVITLLSLLISFVGILLLTSRSD
jgi:hypothetical protein